jgi:hypothetical protein
MLPIFMRKPQRENDNYYECICVGGTERGGGLEIGTSLLDDANASQFNPKHMDVSFRRVGVITWTYRKL